MDQTRELQRDEQLAATLEATFSAQMDGRMKDIHTMLPGIIAEFDADAQTAKVQPAIKRIFTDKGAINLPLCVDVPVAFPGGGDFYLTFPVKPGDECILLFSERCIDLWHAMGSTQPPAEYRLHDLSDAIAQVGLNSQPRKLSAVQTTGAELRTRSRSTYIRLEEGSIYIKGNIIHEGDVHQTGNATRTGNSTTQGLITGQGGMAVSGGAGASITGNVAITGNITNNGKNVGDTHTHSGVQPGIGNTGPVV